MNKTNIKQRLRRTSSAFAIIAALVIAALFTSPKAAAGDTPYGQGALYQIELSAGDNGASASPVGQRGLATTGGGTWLWFALYPDHTADYAGSDCTDAFSGLEPTVTGLLSPPTASFPDSSRISGDATWQYSYGSIPYRSGNQQLTYTGPLIVISNVVLNGYKFITNVLFAPCGQCDPNTPGVYVECFNTTTITIPAAYGNYQGTIGTFMTLPQIFVSDGLSCELVAIDPNSGTSSVQVAGGKPGTTP